MFSRRSADLNLNFLLHFHQAAVDSVGKTDLPPLKHPGKVYYFHQKEGEDQYQIFKLDGQCLETQEDLLQKYWAKFLVENFRSVILLRSKGHCILPSIDHGPT